MIKITGSGWVRPIVVERNIVTQIQSISLLRISFSLLGNGFSLLRISSFPIFAFMYKTKQHIAVIGAGAFGGWTALMLLRNGYKVTLIDAWGAGNSRASSGDETRVIRSVYADKTYAEMAHRAAQLWRENEKNFGMKIFHPIGVLNLIGQDDSRLKAALQHFDDLNFQYEEFSIKEAAKKYPYFNLEDINQVVLENNGGYLLARMGCHVVKECFVKEGGIYQLAAAQPHDIKSEKLEGINFPTAQNCKPTNTFGHVALGSANYFLKK